MASNSFVARLMRIGMGEPLKTFVEMGLTENSGALKEEGRKLYLQWSFNKDQDAFYKDCIQVLEKAEKEEEEAKK